MQVCVYQGSFNPIHNAHLRAAEYVHNEFGFEKIVFIPAFKPPHKDSKDFDAENAMHRLNMVELAVKNIPYFDVSAIEYTRNKPSYTYDTITQIKNIVKLQDKINFIIGTDAFLKIESWYKSKELKELVNFILLRREDNFDEKPYIELKNKGYNYILTGLSFKDISSSEIREKVKKNQNICDIVPMQVAEYIKQNHVYKI